jgi:hypothetical protein
MAGGIQQGRAAGPFGKVLVLPATPCAVSLLGWQSKNVTRYCDDSDYADALLFTKRRIGSGI